MHLIYTSEEAEPKIKENQVHLDFLKEKLSLSESQLLEQSRLIAHILVFKKMARKATPKDIYYEYFSQIDRLDLLADLLCAYSQIKIEEHQKEPDPLGRA